MWTSKSERERESEKQILRNGYELFGEALAETKNG
jgi:hypothetical protein